MDLSAKWDLPKRRRREGEEGRGEARREGRWRESSQRSYFSVGALLRCWGVRDESWSAGWNKEKDYGRVSCTEKGWSLMEEKKKDDCLTLRKVSRKRRATRSWKDQMDSLLSGEENLHQLSFFQI